MTETPRELGFRMPAEWEPHVATWIAWPWNREDWPGKFQPIPWVFTEIIKNLSRFEKVNILVQDVSAKEKATKILQKAINSLDQVCFWVLPTDRIWMRDSGPIFVKNSNGQKAIVDWHFNAWAKYDNWKNDDQIPAKLTKKLKLQTWKPIVDKKRFVLEGGSIDVDGEGTLLTTEECLLSPIQARNPGLSKEQIESTLKDYLGLDRILWLDRGIVGDDTHGHVDDLARFVNRSTIVTASESNRLDENYELLQVNRKRLKAMKQKDGSKYTIVDLPMPKPVIFEGQRLPASYANFYIANGSVLVPTFNDANDRIALNALAKCFPTREIIGIHAVDLVWGLGTLHCMTQQEPVGHPSVGV
jgi:agmatine deiminase